jgi:hypothetical protein
MFYPEENRIRHRKYTLNPGGRMTNQEYCRKYKYEITPEIFEDLIAKQGGRCAICGIKNGNKLDVDHSHETGKVRGLLCHSCNVRIGKFEHNPLSEKMLLYLNMTLITPNT